MVIAGKKHLRHFCWEKEKVINLPSGITALFTEDLLTIV